MRAGRNFWLGFGSVLDVWPSSAARSRLRFDLPSNEDSLRRDWLKTGQDVQEALRLFREQTGVRAPKDVSER
ncbi:MAG: hypothetical protein JJU33_08195 [Phycisphaerales bacterium]|nr:hypothetical protein [Phycisphaerales bacterium]